MGEKVQQKQLRREGCVKWNTFFPCVGWGSGLRNVLVLLDSNFDGYLYLGCKDF